MKISKNLIGIAGTYYVAAELSKRGYIALVTIKNTAAIDLLVSSEGSLKAIGIQVKTNQDDRKKGWVLSKKNEDLKDPNLIYVFVNLKQDDTRPDFYIVPSEILAESIKKGHTTWLNTPGKKGQQHNDNTMRKFFDDNDFYKENWKLIENKINNAVNLV